KPSPFKICTTPNCNINIEKSRNTPRNNMFKRKGSCAFLFFFFLSITVPHLMNSFHYLLYHFLSIFLSIFNDFFLMLFYLIVIHSLSSFVVIIYFLYTLIHI